MVAGAFHDDILAVDRDGLSVRTPGDHLVCFSAGEFLRRSVRTLDHDLPDRCATVRSVRRDDLVRLGPRKFLNGSVILFDHDLFDWSSTSADLVINGNFELSFFGTRDDDV